MQLLDRSDVPNATLSVRSGHPHQEIFLQINPLLKTFHWLQSRRILNWKDHLAICTINKIKSRKMKLAAMNESFECTGKEKSRILKISYWLNNCSISFAFGSFSHRKKRSVDVKQNNQWIRNKEWMIIYLVNRLFDLRISFKNN